MNLSLANDDVRPQELASTGGHASIILDSELQGDPAVIEAEHGQSRGRGICSTQLARRAWGHVWQGWRWRTGGDGIAEVQLSLQVWSWVPLYHCPYMVLTVIHTVRLPYSYFVRIPLCFLDNCDVRAEESAAFPAACSCRQHMLVLKCAGPLPLL